MIRYISLIMLFAIFGLFYANDYPLYYAQFIAAIILLLLEISEIAFFKKKISGPNFFRLNTNDWLTTTLPVIVIIFWLTSNQINSWIVLAVVLVLIFGIIRVYRTSNSIFRIDNEGIWNVDQNKKVLDANLLTSIRYSETEIAIDTSQYINDFQIKSKKLRYPNWEQVTIQIKEFEKRWLTNAINE